MTETCLCLWTFQAMSVIWQICLSRCSVCLCSGSAAAQAVHHREGCSGRAVHAAAAGGQSVHPHVSACVWRRIQSCDGCGASSGRDQNQVRPSRIWKSHTNRRSSCLCLSCAVVFGIWGVYSVCLTPSGRVWWWRSCWRTAPSVRSSFSSVPQQWRCSTWSLRSAVLVRDTPQSCSILKQ